MLPTALLTASIIIISAIPQAAGDPKEDAEKTAKAVEASIKKMADYAYEGIGKNGQNNDKKCKKLKVSCIGQHLYPLKCVERTDTAKPEFTVGTNELLSIHTVYSSGQGGGFLDNMCEDSKNRYLGESSDRSEFESALRFLLQEQAMKLEKVSYHDWILGMLRSTDAEAKKMAEIARNKLSDTNKDKAKDMANFIFKNPTEGGDPCTKIQKHCARGQLTSLQCVQGADYSTSSSRFPSDIKDDYLLNQLCPQSPGENVCDKCEKDTILKEIKDDMVTQPKALEADLFGKLLMYRAENELGVPKAGSATTSGGKATPEKGSSAVTTKSGKTRGVTL